MNKFIKVISENRFVTNERTRKMIRISSISLLLVVFLFGILAGSLLTYSYDKIDKARNNVLSSINSWRNFDLISANASLLASEQNLQALQVITRWTKPFIKLPIIGKRVYAANDMIDSSLRALNSYGDVIKITDDILLYQNTPYDELQNKELLIEKTGEMIDALEDVYVNIQQMLVRTHELGVSDFAIVRQFEEEFSHFQADDFKLLRLMHDIASKRGEQKFLLMMQNNTELRPTGGYVGNAGILTIKDGEVPQFYLSDTDYLDDEIDIMNKYSDREIVKPRRLDQREEKDYINPPEPLVRFFPEYKWRFGDANWSPSFSQTAVNSEKLYNITFSQNEEEDVVFDGVIAFNPELVIDWLKILGGVQIQLADGVEFTAESFDDTPQNLYPGDRINGQVITEKTYIVDAIAQQVRDKFTGASFGLLLDMVSTLRHNVQDNNLMFYFNDPQMQAKLTQYGWDSELKPNRYDYLYVVDSNISRLRIDHMVPRLIDYQVEDVNNTYVATLKLSYNFNLDKEKTEGLFNEKIGDYTTYTRVYVPEGSSMINYDGVEDVDTFNELGKSVLGVFITVKPNTEKTVTLTYVLPFIKNEAGYELVMQKQPGNEFAALRVSLPMPENAEQFLPAKPQINETDNIAVWQMIFDEDQTFVMNKK